MCQTSYFIHCDNYEFKYVFKLYSVDICALSHTSLRYMCVKLKLGVQMYIILYSHLCNVSRLFTRNVQYMTYVALLNMQFMGSKTLFRVCILEICVTLTISYACLQGIHDVCVCVCRPHCLIYKLVTLILIYGPKLYKQLECTNMCNIDLRNKRFDKIN